MEDLGSILTEQTDGRTLLDALDEARTLLSDLAEARRLAEEAETPEERSEAESDAESLAEDEEAAEEVVATLGPIEYAISLDSELIREADFHGYIVQLVEDCYEIKSGWPYYMDWDRIVSDARHDYTELEIGGTTFMVRD